MKEKTSIILIDDDQAVRETLCFGLNAWGYDVRQAENGKQGIALLKHYPATPLVVTDIIMPDKEGLETILDVKRDFPATKVIAISGSRPVLGLNFLQVAQKFGADAILQKPIDLDLLEKTVRQLLV